MYIIDIDPIQPPFSPCFPTVLGALEVLSAPTPVTAPRLHGVCRSSGG